MQVVVNRNWISKADGCYEADIKRTERTEASAQEFVSSALNIFGRIQCLITLIR